MKWSKKFGAAAVINLPTLCHPLTITMTSLHSRLYRLLQKPSQILIITGIPVKFEYNHVTVVVGAEAADVNPTDGVVDK